MRTWWSRVLGQPADAPAERSTDRVERLTGQGWLRAVATEQTTLDDRDTVRRWLRDLSEADDQQVFVHRSWGTVVAVANGRDPVGVLLSDGEKSWFAAPPGAPDDQNLTPDEVELVVLDALVAERAPRWPDWHSLT